MALFDLKTLKSALDELQQERGISRDSVIDALATALAAAYRREYGKRGQIIRATFNPETGDMEFRQAKIVVDKTLVKTPEEIESEEDSISSGVYQCFVDNNFCLAEFHVAGFGIE